MRAGWRRGMPGDATPHRQGHMASWPRVPSNGCRACGPAQLGESPQITNGVEHVHNSGPFGSRRDGSADMFLRHDCSPVTPSILFSACRLARRVSGFPQCRGPRPKYRLRRGCVRLARSFGCDRSPLTLGQSTFSGKSPVSWGRGSRVLKSGGQGRWRRVDHADGRASRRPAAHRPPRSRRKGRGRTQKPEQVSLPADSPTELLRATPPHSLAPSDTINRCFGVWPPEVSRNESIGETSDKARARSSSRQPEGISPPPRFGAPAAVIRSCECPMDRSRTRKPHDFTLLSAAGSESEKTVERKRAATRRTDEDRAGAPSGRMSQTALPILGESLALRERPPRPRRSAVSGGDSRCGQLDIHDGKSKSKRIRQENRRMGYSPIAKRRSPNEIELEKNSERFLAGHARALCPARRTLLERAVAAARKDALIAVVPERRQGRSQVEKSPRPLQTEKRQRYSVAPCRYLFSDRYFRIERGCGPPAYPVKRCAISVMFCPPKPKLLLRTLSHLCSRATLGT